MLGILKNIDHRMAVCRISANTHNIRELQDSDLDLNVKSRDFSVFVILHGVIQHNLYHAGQIALNHKFLIKK